MTSSPIDPNSPFTRDLLRSLTATIRAQPDETEAEYADRFAAATAAFAAFRPRDVLEQMLAAHIVATHYAGLDCLHRAMEAADAGAADRLRRVYATISRAMVNSMRLLDKQRQRPAEAEAEIPPPVIEPVPALRRRPPEQASEEKPAQRPLQRETVRTKTTLADPPKKDPSKMTDAELEAAVREMRALYAEARDDEQHPLHDEALNLRPEDFPGGVVPVPEMEMDGYLLPR